MTTPYLMWAGLLALLMGLTWALYRRPPQVELERELPEQGFAGDQLPLTVRLRVRSGLPARVLIEDPPPRSVVPGAELSLGGLVLGDSVYALHTQLTLNRRGAFEWPPVTLRWADPFGLFWRRTTLAVPTRLDVYPGVHGLILPDLLRPLLSEGALSRTLGLDDPISLRGARPYQPGDPPARVSWRLSARTGELMVRELERTASSRLAVHLDLNGSADYVESAVRLAASLVREALDLDLPVSVSTSAAHATPGGRTPEALRLALRLLAQAQPEPGASPEIPTPGPGSNLIVITQRAGAGLTHAAMRARAGASRVVLVALPEGFYLEPGERGRPLHGAPPDQIRELERTAGVLNEAGVLLFVLRGNQSVLRLGR